MPFPLSVLAIAGLGIVRTVLADHSLRMPRLVMAYTPLHACLFAGDDDADNAWGMSAAGGRPGGGCDV